MHVAELIWLWLLGPENRALLNGPITQLELQINRIVAGPWLPITSYRVRLIIIGCGLLLYTSQLRNVPKFTDVFTCWACEIDAKVIKPIANVVIFIFTSKYTLNRNKRPLMPQIIKKKWLKTPTKNTFSGLQRSLIRWCTIRINYRHRPKQRRSISHRPHVISGKHVEECLPRLFGDLEIVSGGAL